MMKLRINPLVAKDLKEIRDYIADDNLEKATEIIEKIYSKFPKYSIVFGNGAELSECISFRTDYKYAIWNDFVIIYKVGKEFVEIYRVVNRY